MNQDAIHPQPTGFPAGGRFRLYVLAWVYGLACAILAVFSVLMPQSAARWVVGLPAAGVLLVSGLLGANRLLALAREDLAQGAARRTFVLIPIGLNLIAPVLAITANPNSPYYAGVILVGWLTAFSLALAPLQSKAAQIRDARYVPPRLGLFRVVLGAVERTERSPVISGFASLGGLFAILLLIAQVTVFTATWVAVEVVAPLLVGILLRPFVWSAGWVAQSEAHRPARLFLWTVISALPGALSAMVIYLAR